MSEKMPNTLLSLLGEYEKIEVPIVQRDYAQGRHDDHSKMVRQNILADMKSAVRCKTPQLDLNFVYGKSESGTFLPVDGQQRLTTLFLLHLYAFRDDDSKTGLLRKFTYETRASSREFLKALTENRKAVFSAALTPSEEIMDSAWFVMSWKYDPTIQSALTMLDDISAVFGDTADLAEKLSDNDDKPIIFKFLDMNDLGMEDSLYIKLNARGKPLTSFENFKARLIGRLQKLLPDDKFTGDFERNFDGKWTDLFWGNSKDNFDQTYLEFFRCLLLGRGLCSLDKNWSNMFDYARIEIEIFETASFVLNFLSDNPLDTTTRQLVFNALTEKSSNDRDRVLFHALTVYMYASKGIDNGSLTPWLRIMKNLTLNSQIDELSLYQSAVNAVNSLAARRDNLLEYFSESGDVSFFSREQVKEEQIKAGIILRDSDFAEAIYKAERHPYFSGQIRSALQYAEEGGGNYNKDTFTRYWEKISALFGERKSKYSDCNLLRRALLSLGDYTLKVGEYRTLCVDDPDESQSTPSLKRLFSASGAVVKQLLDSFDIKDDIAARLKTLVEKSPVQKTDWRYCLVNFPELFERDWMSPSHLRLRFVNGEPIIVPNKSSNGYNYNVFLSALWLSLKERGCAPDLRGDLGTWADRYLLIKEHCVRFGNGAFKFTSTDNSDVFETTTDDPVTAATEYILEQTLSTDPENG